jgi:hypothetical protein
LALERRKKVCKAQTPGDYEIEVTDLSKRPELAKDRQIVATPAMFLLLLAPVRKSIADLSSEDKARIPSKTSVLGGRERSANLLGSHRIILNEEYFGDTGRDEGCSSSPHTFFGT